MLLCLNQQVHESYNNSALGKKNIASNTEESYKNSESMDNVHIALNCLYKILVICIILSLIK